MANARGTALLKQKKREQDYYSEQSRALTTVIRVFGTFVTLILAIGAVLAVAAKIEAATGGFRRPPIV